MIIASSDWTFEKYQSGEYGDHCIIHGDCRDVLPKIPDKAIDLVLTDPPYGHNNNNNDMIANREAIYGGKNKPKKVAVEDYRPIANDGEEANELFQQVTKEWARLLKAGCCCCCCCCGGGGPDPQFARWTHWLDDAIGFKQMVVWDKGKMGMGHHYRRSYETVLVAQKPGAACKWYDTTKRVENIIRPGDYGITKIIPQADDHPTPKPVELMSHFIGLHSAVGDLVLDCFAGHGPTLVAAKSLGRKVIGIELDYPYCLVIEQRLAQEVLAL